MDREFGSAMGALFHQIITDMKVRMSYSCGRYFLTGKKKNKCFAPEEQKPKKMVAGVVSGESGELGCSSSCCCKLPVADVFEGSCGKLEPPRALNCPVFIIKK